MVGKAVVTGHTRGLGAAIIEQLIASGWSVLGLSRTGDDPVDLGDPSALVAWLGSGRLAAFLSDADEIWLVNNAGVLGPAELAGGQDAAATLDAVNLNVTAPILLTDAVLRHRPGGVPVRIAHISSGAGRRPLPGWSIYCATKAALDHHAVTVASEHHEGVRIAAVAPGVVDTDMQAEIRSSAGFPLRDDFVALKERGELASPATAAAAVLRLMGSDNFGEQPVTRV